MRARVHLLVLATAWAIALGCRGAAPPPADPAEPSMRRMVDAVAAKDYRAFAADGTARLRGIPRPLFDLMTTAYAPRLAKGFRATYVGKTSTGAVERSTWRLVPGDGGKDLRVEVSLVDGKVDSFLLE